ncbi:hypothetical protein B0H19DRAFT_1344980, partial [Mycena capillaripes]
SSRRSPSSLALNPSHTIAVRAPTAGFFLGPYAELDKCPYCEQPQYHSFGRACATFNYLPLIPRLKALFADSEELLYRARYTPNPGKISDNFDSLHYRRLRRRRVRANGTIFFPIFPSTRTPWVVVFSVLLGHVFT